MLCHVNEGLVFTFRLADDANGTVAQFVRKSEIVSVASCFRQGFVACYMGMEMVFKKSYELFLIRVVLLTGVYLRLYMLPIFFLMIKILRRAAKMKIPSPAAMAGTMLSDSICGKSTEMNEV